MSRESMFNRVGGGKSWQAPDGVVITDNRDGSFVDIMKNIYAESAKKKEVWISKLKAENIRASHPDDGWHDREKKSFILCYPDFFEGINVGDKVALGDYDEYKTLEVKEIIKSGFGQISYKY